MSTEFFKKYNAQLKQLSEAHLSQGDFEGSGLPQWQVSVKLNISDVVEAESEEDAIQAFNEQFSSGDEMLEYATTTAKRIRRPRGGQF